MSAVLDLEAVVDAVRRAVGDQPGAVGLHEPVFAGNESAYLQECLDSGWVSYNGPFVKRFEEALAAYVGVKRAVAVVNGTSALFVCLKLAGVEPGDEVLVPAMTFVATANCVCHVGAVPHMVDVSERTLGMDPVRLEQHLAAVAQVRAGTCYNQRTGRRIAAVVPVHCFGNPADLDPLTELCARYGLTMVEDTAQSLGSYYKDKHTGRWGRVSAMSFNGNKIITTGGGGALLTDDDDLADQAVHLTTTAKREHPWEYFHDRVAYNLRMPAICAALGCAQIEQLPGFLERKSALAGRYREALNGVDGVELFAPPPESTPNHWMSVLLLSSSNADARDRVLELLNVTGLGSRPAWQLMHRLPAFEDCPRGDVSVAEDLVRRIVCLPSGVGL